MSKEHSESVVVDLSIPVTAFELGDILRPPPGIEIELVEFVPVDDGPIPYLWIENEREKFEEFVRRVRNDERVSELRYVDAGEGRRLVRLDWDRTPNEFLDACLDSGTVIQHARGTHEQWHFQLRFINQGDLTTFHRRCAEAGVPLTVHRVTSPGPEDGSDQHGLTDTQRETLLLAREEGYFDNPRGITLEELGEELGITRQAVSYRLRDGVRQLIDDTLRDPNFTE